MVAIVGGALFALGPTHGELETLDSRFTPAIELIDETYNSYAETERLLAAAAFATDPAVVNASVRDDRGDELCRGRRMAGVQAGSRSTCLANARAVRTFKADRVLALEAGVAAFTAPGDKTAVFANVSRITAVMLADLIEIKELYETESQAALHDAYGAIGRTQRDMLIVAVLALIALTVAFRLAARGASGREVRLEALNSKLASDSARNELEARLQRSLEMVQSEEASYALITRTLSKSAPGLAAELLLADSSRAHFRQVTKTPELDAGGCGVMSPTECPAAAAGRPRCGSTATISTRVPISRTARVARALRCAFR